MALQFVDSPDRYIDGPGEDIGIVGVWAAVPTAASAGNFQVVTPVFGSRTGNKAFYIATNSATGDARLAIQGAALGEVFFALAHYCEGLPDASKILILAI